MESYLKVRDGIELFYKVNRVDCPKGIILINHGFAEHLGRYDYVTEQFNKSRYVVYRYDLRGHGQTKFSKGHIESYEDFIEDCDEMVEKIKKENNNLPIFMLGHSMGGFVTCAYGLKYPYKLKGQIFSGPAVDTLPPARGVRSNLIQMLNKFLPMKTIKNIVEKDICSVEEVVTDYMNDPLVLKEATVNFYVQFLVEGRNYINKNIGNYIYPCFIAHGEKDKIVPKEIGYYLYNNISSKDKEIKIYDNLYHEILNEKEKDEVLGDMIEWLDKRINDK
jgi:alpha-beta hydrolase superfamily lysophospholipase